MIDLNNLGKGKNSYKKKVEPPKVERTHYMPDEDEVYIGAEFILRHRKTGKTKVDIYNGHISPKLYLSRAGISVTKKYLDKQDIESLGFTNSRKSIDDWYDYIPEHKVQPFSLSYSAFKLTYGKEDRRLKIMGYEYDFKSDEEVLFCGLIKNKSELKRLLKQLGICT